jgi:hypothetical protein
MPPGQGLTLDSTATYRIRVQGRLDASWSDRLSGVTIEHQDQAGEVPVTVLSGALVDQAALAGVLNTLYDLGFPLVSVECVGVRHSSEDSSGPGQPGGS